MVIRGEEGEVSVLYLKDFLGLLFPRVFPRVFHPLLLSLSTLSLMTRKVSCSRGRLQPLNLFFGLREKYEGMKESRERLRFFVRKEQEKEGKQLRD